MTNIDTEKIIIATFKTVVKNKSDLKKLKESSEKEQKKYYTKKEISEILGVSVRTIDRYRYKVTNPLKYYQPILNGSVRFTMEDVETFIKSNSYVR